jgi:hypothetical protein
LADIPVEGGDGVCIRFQSLRFVVNGDREIMVVAKSAKFRQKFGFLQKVVILTKSKCQPRYGSPNITREPMCIWIIEGWCIII